MAAWEAGRTEEALEAFRAATARNAALGQAHHAWIWALAYEGRADEAVAYYERRIREHPTVNDRVCLGIALVRDGRPEAAIEVLETVWREDPNQVGATTWLGTAYFQAGRDADAVAALEDALPRRRSARAPSTPFLLGDVHLRGGRFEKARDVFLEGIRRGGPSAAYFQRHAAYAAALTMEPDEARAWCEKHFPPPGGPYTASHIEMGIGEACYARADLEGTIHHLGAAVQRFPAYPVPRQYLGRAHIVRGDAEAAWDVLPDEGKLRISGLLSPIAWEKGDFEEKACKENPAADLVPSTQGGIDSQADLDDRVKESRDAAEHLRCTARWRRRLARLEEHADAIRQGTYEPDSTRAALDAAEWARCKGAHAVAVAYFQQAFEGYVEEFDDARLRIRYRAARAAARAGEAAGIVSEERKALHVQARGWLEEELPYWRSRLDERPPRGRIHVSIVEPELWHWKYHLDLASVRDADALAKLPDDEREAWEAFWQEVDAVLGTAR